MKEYLIKIKTNKSDLVFKAGSAVESFRRVPDVIAVGGPSENTEKPGHYDIGINFRRLVSEATPEIPEVKEKKDDEGNVTVTAQRAIPAREAVYEQIPGHSNHLTIEWNNDEVYTKEQARRDAMAYLMANQEKGYEFTCEIVK